MLFYIHIALFLFIFLSCGGDTSSTKGFKKSSDINMDIENYSDLEKLKNEAKVRSIVINRNVSKDFLKIEPLKYALSVSYVLSSSINCRDLREYPTLTKGSGDFYKNYTVPNFSIGCIDINYINTDKSGDYVLIIAHGENNLDTNSSTSSKSNASRPPVLPKFSMLIEDMNNYYKNPNELNRESSFNLHRIKGESRTRRVLIIKNVTESYYRNNILNPKIISTSYDISSKDITCQKISKDYIFKESIYKYNLATFPNHIIKEYHLVWYDTWCREWDLINAPEVGKKSFLLTY